MKKNQPNVCFTGEAGKSACRSYWIVAQRPIVLLLLLLILQACSQTAAKPVTFTRTVTTILSVRANVPSEVWVSGQKMGTTPLSFPFSYDEKVLRRTTKENYWETNPGTATAVTVLSLGTYVPFSFIDVEPATESQPSGEFANNRVFLRLVAEGYEPLVQSVLCEGQETVELDLALKEAQRKNGIRKEEGS